MQLPIQTFAIKGHQGNVSHDHDSCTVYCKKRRNRRIYFAYEHFKVRESIDKNCYIPLRNTRVLK